MWVSRQEQNTIYISKFQNPQHSMYIIFNHAHVPPKLPSLMEF